MATTYGIGMFVAAAFMLGSGMQILRGWKGLQDAKLTDRSASYRDWLAILFGVPVFVMGFVGSLVLTNAFLPRLMGWTQ